ncbi:MULTISPECIES: TetR family transcriptional regulator [Arthrobacter]|uniref:TetR family transcriptional regulator n=2 Tax=Arthrobacter TaxID=1663 RepID=A0ABU9KIP7_9MICC|nr:TetR family transcriptional regulator [Arthrobacter sp. YJM1]MDP5226291.1 TetR family transcriptional regulator [Arthrobacter sp. YJM1]
MVSPEFQRARSQDAKQQRQEAILRSAEALAREHGVRAVTLTDIAGGVGMHKSGMLRYFETREEIFLHLARDAWAEWASSVEQQLDEAAPHGSSAVSTAQVLSSSLIARPLFCDLLAHVPLNLERGVSAESVREFKIAAITAAGAVASALQRCLGLAPNAAWNTVSTATAMAGALWQMATPGADIRALYESDPDLAHAVVEVEPRLTDILTALIDGYTHTRN